MDDGGGMISDVMLTAAVVAIVLFLAFVVGPNVNEVVSNTPTP
jgi:hypothetical protein